MSSLATCGEVEHVLVVAGGEISACAMCRDIVSVWRWDNEHTKSKRRFGGGQGATEVGESPVLREAKSAVGRAWIRRLRRGAVPAVLCGEDGAAQSGPGSIFSPPVAWLLRRPGLGTRHRLACGGLLRSAHYSGSRTEAAPDHSTISRTRRLIDLDTHRAVFTWVVQCLGIAGLVKGKTIAIDATTLEANATLRSIVHRDTGESYHEFLTKLAQASGIETPTREDLAKLDRKRKKKGRTRTGNIRTTPTRASPR